MFTEGYLQNALKIEAENYAYVHFTAVADYKLQFNTKETIGPCWHHILAPHYLILTFNALGQ